jgi:hypothetical protein
MADEQLHDLIRGLNDLVNTLKRSSTLGEDRILRTRREGISADEQRLRRHEALQQKKVAEAYKISTNSILGNVEAMKRLMSAQGDITSSTRLARKQLEDTFDVLNSDELEKSIGIFKDALDSSSNAIVKSYADQIHSAESILRFQDEFLGTSAELFGKLNQQLEERLVDEDRYGTEIDNIITSLGLQNTIVGDASDKARQLAEVFEEAAAVTAQYTERATKQSTINLFKFAGQLKATTVALVGFSKPLINAGLSAARTGTQLEVLAAAARGMSPEELNQLQAEHRRIIASSNLTLDEFNNKISEGASSLITYTGSLRDAHRMNAESFNMARVLGTEQGKFMREQQERFKHLNRTISMSAEQFMEMNKQLMDSRAVQEQIYRINVAQRGAFFQDLQNTYEKLTIDGLLHEQAMKVVETLAAIGAKSPRERMREAAKMQAVMGAMGMGDVGAEAAELYRRGLRGEGEAERFAELMKQAQTGIGEVMGRDFASEMLTAQIIESAGLGQLLGPQSDFADLNVRQTVGIDNFHDSYKKLGGEANAWLERIFHINSVGTSFLTGPMGQMLGQIVAIMVAMKAMGIGGAGLGGRGLGTIGRGMGGKILGLGGGVMGGLATGYLTYQQLKDDERVSGEERWGRTLGSGIGTTAGVAGGMLAGMKMGAMTGMVGGPLGAIIGTLVGGAAGAVLGESIGGSIGTVLKEGNMEQTKHLERVREREAEDREEEEKKREEAEKQNLATNERTAELLSKVANESEQTNQNIKEQTRQQREQHDEKKRGEDNWWRLNWLRKVEPIGGSVSGLNDFMP